MDQYSFLNTAHTAYFAELYDQYLINPEHVEPSWRAFFQAEDGIRDRSPSRGLGDVYKRQTCSGFIKY